MWHQLFNVQWSRVQKLYKLPQWVSPRLRNVSDGSHLQGWWVQLPFLIFWAKCDLCTLRHNIFPLKKETIKRGSDRTWPISCWHSSWTYDFNGVCFLVWGREVFLIARKNKSPIVPLAKMAPVNFFLININLVVLDAQHNWALSTERSHISPQNTYSLSHDQYPALEW